MQTYALSDVRNRHGEVFDRAFVEPVLVTKKSRRTHVIMAASFYDALVERMAKLEDRVLGAAADEAVASSRRVGSEAFTAALKRLADAEA
ncbi:MAG: type II toxin-antitoxin system prevent-host-death family antitoxin [Hyphomicrobiales bacterium]